MTLDTDTKVQVINNLTSSSTTAALSANQGRLLNQSVSNGKTQVANAITGKGVAASGSDSFATLASKISHIKSLSSGIYSGQTRRLSHTWQYGDPAKTEYLDIKFGVDFIMFEHGSLVYSGSRTALYMLGKSAGKDAVITMTNDEGEYRAILTPITDVFTYSITIYTHPNIHLGRVIWYPFSGKMEMNASSEINASSWPVSTNDVWRVYLV